MASRNFTHLTQHLARARVDYGADAFKAIIVGAIPTETQLDTWDFLNDLTIEIGASGGYSAGGFIVTPTVGSIDAANNRIPITFAAATPTYENATISGVGCVIYKVGGNAASSPLLHFVDWNGTVTSTNGNFQATFSTPFFIQG